MPALHRSLILLAPMLLACGGDQGPTRDDTIPLTVRTRIDPAYRPLIRPVTHVRYTIANLGSGRTVEQRMEPVEAGMTEWPLFIDVRMPERIDVVTLRLTVELVHRSAAGDVVEASGRVDLYNFGPSSARAHTVMVFPGPADYLELTGIRINPPAPLIQGSNIILGATPTGGIAPRLFWASSSPGVASVTPAGVLSAVSPGRAMIRVYAGMRTDSVQVEVTAAAGR